MTPYILTAIFFIFAIGLYNLGNYWGGNYERLTLGMIDLDNNSRIYPAGNANEGFIIGGLSPSQAKQLVIRHNKDVRELEKATPAQLAADETLSMFEGFVKATREWNNAVEHVMGRQPATGIPLSVAEEHIKKIRSTQ